jgi:hypothetical protein
MPLLSKSEYARARLVKPCVVSNWIRRGKLSGAALVDGRIDSEAADRQLALTVDPVLQASRPRGRPQTQPAASPIDFSAAADLLRARATMAGVQAQRAWIELQREKGRYTLTEEAQAKCAKMLSEFLLSVEQSLTDLAETLRLGNDGAVELRRWWRRQRVDAARANREKATTQPQFIEDPDFGRGAEIS